MPNKNYRNGYNFERRVKQYLESCGYFVVRSAGSKGAADLIAICEDDFTAGVPQVYLVQCKLNGQISKEEKSELLRICKAYNCNPCIATLNTKRKIEFEGWYDTQWLLLDM